MVDSIKSEIILPLSIAQEHLEVGQFLLPPDGYQAARCYPELLT